MSLHLSPFQLFLSRYIFLSFSTQMLIQYYTVPLSTHYSKFSHSLYPSAIHNITLSVLLYTHTHTHTHTLRQQHFTICPMLLPPLLSLSSFISRNPLAAQFDIPINLLYIYHEPCVFPPRPTQSPHLSSKHNLWFAYQFVYIIRYLCPSTGGSWHTFVCFRFLWPCIVNIRWREGTNNMQLIRCLLSNFLPQHVSGIIMTIIRRIRPCLTACGVLPGV